MVPFAVHYNEWLSYPRLSAETTYPSPVLAPCCPPRAPRGTTCKMELISCSDSVRDPGRASRHAAHSRYEMRHTIVAWLAHKSREPTQATASKAKARVGYGRSKTGHGHETNTKLEANGRNVNLVTGNPLPPCTTSTPSLCITSSKLLPFPSPTKLYLV